MDFAICRSKDSQGPKTQFVVTLDSLGFPTKKQAPIKEMVRETSRKIVELSMDEPKRTPISTRIGKRSAEIENENELLKMVENSRISKVTAATKRKRTPIRFNTNDRSANDRDEIEPAKKRRSRSSERKSIERKSTDREHRKSTEKDDNRRRDKRSTERDRERERDRDSNEHAAKVRTVKTTSQSKYDNLPPRKYIQPPSWWKD